MNDLKVLKKDGTIEDFDVSKLSAGLVSAGLAPAQSDAMAGQIETWAKGVAVDGVINSTEIRQKVVELLGAANPAAVEAYQNYRKIAA